MNGHLVALVGPDGAGKTTVAAELARAVGPARFTYFHFAPPLTGGSTPSPGLTSSRDYPPDASTLGTSLRMLKNFCRFWLGYLISVKPRLRQGHLVVADRWAYSYIVDPASVRFGLSERTAERFVATLPQPSAVFVLEAPVEVILERKEELTADEIELQIQRWRSLPVRNLHLLDATIEPQKIASQILDALSG